MDPSKMKVVDLRSELGALGLDTKGNKPALVDRLKKALEAKTGKAMPDTSILDTSTEDAYDPDTPRRAVPAPRTTRRSSSSRLAATPAKPAREEPPIPIEEESNTPEEDARPSQVYSPSQDDSEPEMTDPKPVEHPKEQTPKKEKMNRMQNEDDSMDKQEDSEDGGEKQEQDDEKMEQDGEEKNGDDKDEEDRTDERRELTEEEEWEELNERLRIREQERLERERLQAEEDARRLEELSKDPIKLNRLKRKQEKKKRWSGFYRAVEVTNEVLTLPEELNNKDLNKGKKAEAEVKMPAEPEIDDNKVTLSWYDSDLNQYLEVPDLNGVVPLSEGAFAHAWAGARASRGVDAGRVCYEVRVGSVVTTTESSEKEAVSSGLRIGWSTDDSSLHLGEGELSWGFESTGRAVHNGEFKEYGKQLAEKDVVGAYIDLESNPCKISYTLNGLELGVAYEFDKSSLDGKAVFPHILTKNMCYKVNFGYDRYNMLTKTKMIRKSVEIPVEQVLEEKRAVEAEIQRQKEEAARKKKERIEREKKEREERQRKKREERERIEREKKEKEEKERKERGEETEEGKEEDKETDKEAKDGSAVIDVDKEKEDEQSKENGDQAATETAAPVEVKQEPMDTEQPADGKPVVAVVDKPVNEEAEAEPMEVTEEQVLKGQVLDKRIKFVIRHTVEEELDGAEACLVPGYVLIAHGELVDGPARPASVSDCEVILMVGMPGTGKTYWAKHHAASHPEKRYNILSTGALFDKMKVDCKPFRATYEGKWDAMVSKCAKCVLKLLEIAKGRRRNFILDQTNVYPSAQRRKLKEFDGYRRVAVVIVTDEETYKERTQRREEADGKEVPDGAIVDMKANFTLPEKSSWLDEVIFPELDEEEARAVLEGYHKEAKAAGVTREKEKRSRSPGRDAPPAKRQRSGDKRRDERRGGRDFGGRDREDRWGGGGGRGGRWGPVARGGGGGGAGGRWGPPRDNRGAGAPPGGRFDRPWGPPLGGRDDFGGGRDRDNFRGGRGGPVGPGGPIGPIGPGGAVGPGGLGGPGGPRGGDRGRGPPNDQNNRFGNKDRNRSQEKSGLGDKRAVVLPKDLQALLSKSMEEGTVITTKTDEVGEKRFGGFVCAGAGTGGGIGSWQRGGQMGGADTKLGGMGGAGGGMGGTPGRATQSARANQLTQPAAGGNQKDGQNQTKNQNSGNQSGWNQWVGGWGGFGNWQQNHGWGNWGNYTGGQSDATGGQTGGANSSMQGQQWPANYTPQQWQQWEQWRQQQQQWQQWQQWPGYQQGNQSGTNADAQAAWAQYYKNYGAGATNTNTGSQQTSAGARAPHAAPRQP